MLPLDAVDGAVFMRWQDKEDREKRYIWFNKESVDGQYFFILYWMYDHPTKMMFMTTYGR